LGGGLVKQAGPVSVSSCKEWVIVLPRGWAPVAGGKTERQGGRATAQGHACPSKKESLELLKEPDLGRQRRSRGRWGRSSSSRIVVGLGGYGGVGLFVGVGGGQMEAKTLVGVGGRWQRGNT